MDVICLKIRITGMVQGVGFRYHLREKALILGLHGWVRNNADASVTAFVQGKGQRVYDLVDWSRKGPPMSKVVSVDIDEQQPDPGLNGFSIVF